MSVIKTSQLNTRMDIFELAERVGILQDPEKNKKRLNQRFDYINNMHKGEDIAVIGSGFSGREVDKDLLKNMVTIGINHTIDFFGPDHLIFQDLRFLQCNKYDLESFPGYIFTANSNPFSAMSKHKKIVHFLPLKTKPSTDINDGLYHRTSTGLCALNLALVMGAKKVYIIGCDTPKDFEKCDYPDGVHIIKDYAGGVETVEQIKKYLTVAPMYKSFQPFSDRIINVCENGHIPYFQQIKMSTFNDILKNKTP